MSGYLGKNTYFGGAAVLISVFLFMFLDQARQKPLIDTSNIPLSEQGVLSWQFWSNKNKLSLQEYIDTEDDASLYKYVSRKKPFTDIRYTPATLVPISSDYVTSRGKGMKLRPETHAALNDLAKAFYTEFGFKLYLVSAYRSYREQKSLLDDGCSRSLCAKAGTSEHQAGLAIDIHVGDDYRLRSSIHNKDGIYYKWLEQNAYKFGWHNTFQKGIDVDGQIEEGRHWRYLGRNFATYLWEHDISLGEYYENKKSSE